MATKEELLEGIKSLSVMDLAELVKALEEEFGVSAAAPVAVAAAPAAGDDGGAAEEQTEFWSASWVSPVAAELDPRAPDDPAYDLTAAAYDEAGWNDRPAS